MVTYSTGYSIFYETLLADLDGDSDVLQISI
jgi:hypothetical protein